MQTSSKVDKFNKWDDLGVDIMNIRPKGTYKPRPCHCHCHHHHHPCPPPPHKPHPGMVPPPPYGPVPVPPHYHDPFCPCPPEPCHPVHPHFRPVDIDGDGFVEADVIVKPEHFHPVPPPPCCHPEPGMPLPPPPFYGAEAHSEDEMSEPVMEEQEVHVDSETYSEPIVNDELNEVLIDVWTEPTTVPASDDNEVMMVPEETPEISEIEEPVKPTRTRRVNRGGRRKKD